MLLDRRDGLRDELGDVDGRARAPSGPAANGLVDLVIRPAAWLVRRLGLDANYRRLRADRRLPKNS